VGLTHGILIHDALAKLNYSGLAERVSRRFDGVNTIEITTLSLIALNVPVDGLMAVLYHSCGSDRASSPTSTSAILSVEIVQAQNRKRVYRPRHTSHTLSGR
jgi:hypothetical protein